MDALLNEIIQEKIINEHILNFDFVYGYYYNTIILLYIKHINDI